MRKFYLPTDPKPEVLPPYLVITPNGAWAADDQQDAIDLRDTLLGAKVTSVKIVQVAR